MVAGLVVVALSIYGWFAYQDFQYLRGHVQVGAAQQAYVQIGLQNVNDQYRDNRLETNAIRRGLTGQRITVNTLANDMRVQMQSHATAVPQRYKAYDGARVLAYEAKMQEVELKVSAIDWLLRELPDQPTQSDLTQLTGTRYYADLYARIDAQALTSSKLDRAQYEAFPRVFYIGPGRSDIYPDGYPSLRQVRLPAPT